VTFSVYPVAPGFIFADPPQKRSFGGDFRSQRSSLPQERHCVRRLAFSVPHGTQRKYIVRANQDVMIALRPRIAINTTAFSSHSFNL